MTKIQQIWFMQSQRRRKNQRMPDSQEPPLQESILDEILGEAENINRYLYTAKSVAVFDEAHEAAQSAKNGSAGEQEQEDALLNLREAIDSLAGASFSLLGTQSISVKVNTSIQIILYVVYDGIGDVTIESSDPESIEIIDNSTANMLKTGMFSVGFRVPCFPEEVKIVSVIK